MMMCVICEPRSGKSSGSTAPTTLMPMNEKLPAISITVAPSRFALRQVQVEKERGRAQDHAGVNQAIDHGERRLPQHVCDALDGRHQRILDRAFPPLDADHVRDPVKDHRQVAPDDGADRQVQDEKVAVHALPAELFHPHADVAHRQRVDDGIDQPHHFPRPVAFDDVDVALDESVTSFQFVHCSRHFETLLCYPHPGPPPSRAFRGTGEGREGCHHGKPHRSITPGGQSFFVHGKIIVTSVNVTLPCGWSNVSGPSTTCQPNLP